MIIPSQLCKARKIIQLEPEEVAQALGVGSDDILSWEDGRLEPTLEQLELLAEIYGRGIDYFLRETPNPPEKVEFRAGPEQSLKSLPKEARIVISKFDELCRTAFELESLAHKTHIVELSPLNQPRILVDAQRLRIVLGANNKPIRNLREVLEEQGFRIFEIPVPNNAFSGFSNWHPQYGPCILINAKELPGRKNFTLAHECAHLLYHHDSSLCKIALEEVTTREESIANKFAVELLLPESGVRSDFRRRALSTTPSEKQLAQMSGKWHVSIEALGYRLESLQLIKKGVTKKLKASWEARGRQFRRRPKAPTWERRLGKRFVSLAVEAHQGGNISISKLAHSLGIPIRKAMEVANTYSKSLTK